MVYFIIFKYQYINIFLIITKILFFNYIAIGHSYGANFLVNYLGKAGEKSLINGAVSIVL